MKFVALAAFCAGSALCGCARDTSLRAVQTEAEASGASHAEITFDWLGPDKESKFCMSDEQWINDLVLAPLDNAVPDANPARYEILGYLSVRTKDRDMWVVLFVPWGRIKINDEYKIADLSKLGAQITEDFDYLVQNVINRSK